MIDILTEEQQKLVENNHNLIYSFLKKHNLYVDDFYDLAAIGLCVAAERFNKDLGAFSTYAYKCMYTSVHNYLRVEKYPSTIPKDIILSINAEYSMEEGNTAELINVLADPRDLEKDCVERIALEQSLNKIKLTQKENEVLNYLREGLSKTEIATTIGCSKQCVSATVFRIRKKLKKVMRE